MVEEQRLQLCSGGSNLGEIDDIEYFKKKLYRSLNVPISRLEADLVLVLVVQQRLHEMNLNLQSLSRDLERSLHLYSRTF